MQKDKAQWLIFTISKQTNKKTKNQTPDVSLIHTQEKQSPAN